MKKITLLLVTALLAFSVMSCGKSMKGKTFKGVEGEATYKFIDDKTLEMTALGQTITASYEIDGDYIVVEDYGKMLYKDGKLSIEGVVVAEEK